MVIITINCQLSTINYLLQSFVLFLAVGTYVDSISPEQIVLEGLFEKVEILVEERLRRDIEPQSGIRL